VSHSAVSSSHAPRIVGQLVLSTLLLLWASAGAAAAASLTTVGPDFPAGTHPGALSFSSDGGLLAVADAGDQSVSLFTVGAAGLLTKADILSGTGSAGPRPIAFSPKQGLLAVSDVDSGAPSVSLLAVSVVNGTVTTVPRATMLLGRAPTSLTFSPDGSVLVVVNEQDDSLTTFSVSAAGSLTEIASGVPTGDQPRVAVFSRDQKLLVVANRLSPALSGGALSTFTVSPAGDLSPVAPDVSTRAKPSSIAFGADGSTLAVGLDGHAGLSLFGVGSEDHHLAELAAPAQVGFSHASLSSTSDGEYLASVDQENDRVSVLTTSADGQITASSGPMSTGDGPVASATDPNGRLLAVANSEGGTVSMFALSAGGVLTPIGSPILPGGHPRGMAFVPLSDPLLAVITDGDQPDGSDSSISTFRLSADGHLSPGVQTSMGLQSGAVAMSSQGLLATATSSGIATFTFSSAGVPSPTAPPIDEPFWSVLAFSKVGGLLAVARADTDLVTTFAVSAGGGLTPIGTPVPLGSGRYGGPADLAFSPDGRFLALAESSDRSLVSTFAVSPHGQLTPIASAFAGEIYASLAFSPDGHLLAVTAGGISGSGVVSMFRMAGGVPVPVGAPIRARTTGSVAFSPHGDVVVAAGSGGLSLFTVTDDGTLTAVGEADLPNTYQQQSIFSPDGRFIASRDSFHDSVFVFPLIVSTLDTFISAASPTATITKAKSAEFTFSANYPSTLECRLDGRAFDACSSPVAYDDLDEGHHTFTVRARDLLGHVEGTPAARSWAIDLTAPDPAPLNAPADGAPAVAAAAAFTWSPTSDNVTGVDRYTLYVDDQLVKTVAPDVCAALCRAAPEAPLSDGAHTWRVEAIDGAGNRSTSLTRHFGVDATAPDPFALTTPGDGIWTGTHRPRLSWQTPVDAGTGVSRYAVTIDDVVVNRRPITTTSWTPDEDLADGPHRWQVTAYDVNGNARASSTRGFTIDTVGPVAGLVVTPSPATAGQDVTFDASGSHDAAPGSIAGYEWDLDGDGSFETTTAGPTVTHTYAATAPVTVPVSVRVTDHVGETATAVHDLRVIPGLSAASVPSVSIDDQAQYTNNANVKLSIVAPAFATKMEISNDASFASAPSSAVTAKLSWKLDVEGAEHSARRVSVRFTMGLASSDAYSDEIILDQAAPVVRSSSRALRNGRVTLRLSASDRGLAGIDSVQTASTKTHPQKGFQKVSFHGHSATVKLAADKLRKRLYVRVRDKAGNVSGWARVPAPQR
jgi:6-phosphogluconolactonase (cycloisomerase 2 family)